MTPRRKQKKKFSTDFGKAVGKDAKRRKREQSGYGYLNLPSGIPIFNPDNKRVQLDIIPYIVSDPNHPDRYEDEGIAVPNTLWYKRPFSIHRNIGVENDTVVCLRSVKQPCPICEYREKALKEGTSWEDLKDFKASDRNLYVVIPIKSKAHDEVIHIWDMSDFLFQQLLDEELKEDEDYWTFPDLENGKTLRIRFDEESFKGNKFYTASRIDFYDRQRPYSQDILDDVPDLDEVLKVLSYQEVEQKFLEIGDVDVADEGIETEGHSRSKYIDEPAGSDEVPEEDWEEEPEEFEEEEDWEEDFEEEDDWDDWEDEEEDDWEEEPEPEPEPKRTRSKPAPKKKPKGKSNKTTRRRKK